MSIVIQINNLCKEYRLGLIGHGTLTRDLQSWWSRIRGLEDPNSLIPVIEGQKQTESDRFWALRNVSFEVCQGQALGIIGKNGAGKSTLLKLLSRVTAPTRGQIKVKGRIASLLEVGTGFHPELTGRENIYMNGAILGMTKGETRSKIDEIIDFSGVEKFIDTPVKRYSSGMRVRLGFAVAAHLDPEILIIDEVLAVGDAEFQKKCLGKMDKITRSGRTILFVSHNLLSVKRLCSRVILLKDGGVHLDGEPEAAVSGYLESQREIGSLDLSKRNDRNGSGEIMFESVSFLDSKLVPLSRDIVSGDDIVIQMRVKSQADNPNISFSIAFFSDSGHMMFSCLSSANNKIFNCDCGVNTIYCRINKFPLSSGMYYYNVNIKKDNFYCDQVKEAGYLKVESGDFFGTGKLPAPSHNSVYINFEYI